MTRIYEALEEARKRGASDGSGAVVPFPPPPDAPVAENPRLKDAFTVLYQAILMAFSHEPRKIVQFVEVTRGAGGFSLVREFAKFLVVAQRLRVLLAVNGSEAEARRAMGGMEWIPEPEGILPDGVPLLESVRRHPRIPLHFARFSQSGSVGGHALDTDPISPFFERLRRKFDLVLLVMPAAGECQDFLMFSPNVDGIILVLEAEKTRWQVAQKVKNCLLSQGGNLLGAVLNNRRYPIPEMVYRRL
jgi:hypothetical protein